MKTNGALTLAGIFAATGELLALEYPGWSKFTSGVTPQTIVFTNHGTLTISNAVGMTANFPQYYLHSGLNNVPSPFTNALPALWPRGPTNFSWTTSFAPPLNASDFVIITDVDNNESAIIRAYDADGLAVGVTNWSLTLADPILPDAGFRGTVTRTNHQISIAGYSNETSEEMAIFRPATGQSVARLDYDYQNTGTGGGPTIAFATEDCGCCPKLQVEWQSANLLISWPATGSNCLLQTAVSLSPFSWTNWNSPPDLIGNRLQNVIAPVESARFFRLKRL